MTACTTLAWLCDVQPVPLHRRDLRRYAKSASFLIAPWARLRKLSASEAETLFQKFVGKAS